MLVELLIPFVFGAGVMALIAVHEIQDKARARRAEALARARADVVPPLKRAA